jgi:hypothetical protein
MEHLVEMEGYRCVVHNQEWHPKKEDERHNRGHNLLGRNVFGVAKIERRVVVTTQCA